MKHLSRFDIEAIADKYVQAYMALPDVRNTQIYRIDPELLLEKVLGLNVEYQHLSYDGSILGMTSFTEMGVQVFEDDDNEAFFFLDGKTVLVEKDLNFDSKLKGRKNFTLMHEGSHQIFKMLFPNDYGVTQKSAGVHYYKANSERNKPISDWEEWQANTLGAAILLPENLIKQGMYLFSLGEKIECLNKIYYPSVYKRFDALADFLGCSKKALAIRMKQLGLLKKEYEYHGYTGTEKWAIVTELAEEELWVKYPDVIRRYTPFILLSMAQGEVITEYQNYEARERMRRLLFGHAFDINDGEFEVHHPELAVDTDPIEEIMLKDNIKRLREVLCYLSETQKRRVFKYFFYNKTLEKIADEEGVDFTSVRESVNSAIKKLRKFF